MQRMLLLHTYLGTYQGILGATSHVGLWIGALDTLHLADLAMNRFGVSLFYFERPLFNLCF